MNEPSRLISWLAVLLFTFGALGAFCKLRDFYYRRGWPDPLNEPADDGEQWPQLRLSLRRDK